MFVFFCYRPVTVPLAPLASGQSSCVWSRLEWSRRLRDLRQSPIQWPVRGAGRQRRSAATRVLITSALSASHSLFFEWRPQSWSRPFLTFLPVFVCARRSSFNDAHDKKQKDVGRQVSLTKTRALIKFSDWSGDQFGRPVLMAHFMQMNGPAVCCVSTWTRSRDESASAEIKSSPG